MTGHTTGQVEATAGGCASVDAVVDGALRVDLLAGHGPCVPERHPEPEQPVVLGLPAECELAVKDVAGHGGLRRVQQEHLRENSRGGGASREGGR